MQLDRIKKQLSEIDDLVKVLEEKNIYRLDKDLVLQKLRDLYEQVFVLEETTLLNPEKEGKIEVVEEKVVGSVEKEDEVLIVEKADDTFVEETETGSIPEEKPEVLQEEIINDSTEEIQEEESKDFFEELPVDLFSRQEMSSSDQSPTEKLKSVEDKIRMNKIGDLKKAIGINEKFQFINELFKGDIKEYTITIDDLNMADSYDEAKKVLDTCAEKYSWPENLEAYELLRNMTERRYL